VEGDCVFPREQQTTPDPRQAGRPLPMRERNFLRWQQHSYEPNFGLTRKNPDFPKDPMTTA